MKVTLIIVLLLGTGLLHAQMDFNYIDRRIRTIDANDPAALSHLLTDSFPTQKEKVRSIFRWITENISYYRMTPLKGKKLKSYQNYFREEDLSVPDTGELKTVTERVAIRMLKERRGHCDGYARLFKSLCDHAGIEAVINTGYARSDMDRAEKKFRSNHAWNAVYIDSAWYLLDATWASGFTSTSSGEFIKRYDNYYFLTPPEEFIRHHYPDDPRWTLMEKTPALYEFRYTPFLVRSYVKYPITDFYPSRGIIEAEIGDTIRLELETELPYRSMSIAPDSLWEPADRVMDPGYAYLEPTFRKGNKASYSFPVDSETVEWLHLMYNDDAVLRYKLVIKNKKGK
jgi:hypothetical protein